MSKKIILFFGLFLFVTAAIAAPVIPSANIKSVSTKDSTALIGDESGCFYINSDGNIIGNYKFPKTKIASKRTYPTSGDVKTLVLLVEFADMDFSGLGNNVQEKFENLFNQPGYSFRGEKGSVRDYFQYQSNNQFNPDFVVHGPIKLNQNYSYYGADIEYIDDNIQQLMIDACIAVDEEIDFSEYDTNNDGEVDNVIIIYAGGNQNENLSNSNYIWPQQSNVGTQNKVLDGVKLSSFMCVGSMSKNLETITSIGTICHEFSHVLGLPDLYTTNGVTAYTPQYWSLMDLGFSLGSGTRPVNMTVYERYALGWLNPIELNTPANIQLPSIANNVGYIIKTEKENEYYLLENRQLSGWDSDLKGHGMLIWHICYDEAAWKENRVNNDPVFQRVDLVEANGKNAGPITEPFPGYSANRRFTDETTPSMISWDKVRLNKPITGIREENGNIFFKFIGGIPIDKEVIVNDAKNIEAHSFFISWNLLDEADGYIVDVYQKEADGSKKYIYDSAIFTKESNSSTIPNLQSETTYYVVVRAIINNEETKDSREVVATTVSLPFVDRTPIVNEATGITNTAFVANWESLPDVDSYEITVIRREYQRAYYDSLKFDDGLMVNFPNDWATNSDQASTEIGFYGESAPAIVYTLNGHFVRSPMYLRELAGVSFWIKPLNTNENDYLTVQLFSRIWFEALRIRPTNPEGEIITIPHEMLAGTVQIAFVYDKKSIDPNSKIILDDFKVTYGNKMLPFSTDYTDYNVGNHTSFELTGFEPEKEYSYTIVAIKGTERSQVSKEMIVKLPLTTPTDVTSPIKESNYYLINNCLFIRDTTDAFVQIWSLTGQNIFTGKIGANGKTLPSGVYILKIGEQIDKIWLK